jgi:hypothetical protein
MEATQTGAKASPEPWLGIVVFILAMPQAMLWMGECHVTALDAPSQ